MRYGLKRWVAVGFFATLLSGCASSKRHCCQPVQCTCVKVIASNKPVDDKLPLAEGSEHSEKIRRRSFGDITANPCFGHAPDYTWLSGELQQSRADKDWHLRYATVDEDDPYGGSVILKGAPLTDHKSGQMVRVTGHLTDPDTHVPNSIYLFNTIEALPGLPAATPPSDTAQNPGSRRLLPDPPR
jgi:hypothetical protein